VIAKSLGALSLNFRQHSLVTVIYAKPSTACIYNKSKTLNVNSKAYIVSYLCFLLYIKVPIQGF
jgi:hypothetical protein